MALRELRGCSVGKGVKTAGLNFGVVTMGCAL